MGALTKLLWQIHNGEVTAEEAAPRIREIVDARPPDELSREATWRRMAGVQDERDATDTYIEVTAFWMARKISDEQYAALRAGALS